MTSHTHRGFRIALDGALAVAAVWSWLTRPAPTPPEEDHVLPCARWIGGEDQAARERAVKVCADAWVQTREIERGMK